MSRTQSVFSSVRSANVWCSSLINLAEHRNGSGTNLQRLTHSYHWHCPAELFEDCKSQKKHRCSRLQELAVLGEAKSPEVLVRNDNEIRAVVFRYAAGFSAIVEHERQLRVREREVVGRSSIVQGRGPAREATPDSGYSSRSSRPNHVDVLQPSPASRARDGSNALVQIRKVKTRRAEGGREVALREERQPSNAPRHEPASRAREVPHSATRAKTGRTEAEHDEDLHGDGQAAARGKQSTTKKSPKPPGHSRGSSKTSSFLGFRL